MSETNDVISEAQAERVCELLTRIKENEEKIKEVSRQVDSWEVEIYSWKREIEDVIKHVDPNHHANKLFFMGANIQPRSQGTTKKFAMIGTNRQKITTAISNFAEGATFEDIHRETDIPPKSLASELSKNGLELYGIEKVGRGKDARYFLKTSGTTR